MGQGPARESWERSRLWAKLLWQPLWRKRQNQLPRLRAPCCQGPEGVWLPWYGPEYFRMEAVWGIGGVKTSLCKHEPIDQEVSSTRGRA